MQRFRAVYKSKYRCIKKIKNKKNKTKQKQTKNTSPSTAEYPWSLETLVSIIADVKVYQINYLYFCNIKNEVHLNLIFEIENNLLQIANREYMVTCLLGMRNKA